MSETNVITLRVPWELKRRLEKQARFQGVSINQLSNYLLNEQLTQLELLSSLESRLAEKSIDDLRIKVSNMLKKIPRRETPSWDEIQQ
jgi:hypothetical protein